MVVPQHLGTLLRNLPSYTLAIILYHYQSNTNGQTAFTVRNKRRTKTFGIQTIGSEFYSVTKTEFKVNNVHLNTNCTPARLPFIFLLKFTFHIITYEGLFHHTI